LHEGHGHDECNQQDIGVDGHEGLVGLHVVLTLQKESHADEREKQKGQVDVVQSKSNVDLRVINPPFPGINSLNLAESDIKESLIEGERFFEFDIIVALGGYSTSARPPEKDYGVDSNLENETGHSAHEFVIGSCSFF
jgi:nucleoside-diphosphate-sugar epimerase